MVVLRVIPSRRATAIIRPAIRVIWTGDSLVLVPRSRLQSAHSATISEPILLAKIAHSTRFVYFNKKRGWASAETPK